MGSAERANPFARKTQIQLPAEAADRFGHYLMAGDAVLVMKETEQTWKVEGVRPDPDPGRPPNAVIVELSTTLRIVARSGQVIHGLVRVRTAAEQGLPLAAPESLPARAPWWRRAFGFLRPVAAAR